VGPIAISVNIKAFMTGQQIFQEIVLYLFFVFNGKQGATFGYGQHALFQLEANKIKE
jgi:hypothetical protein